ncbi:hypothetical protein BJ138DRAFT_1140509 [Hygrophoropsis aurantiaca]|uniref:Uncharacterized protein n=1 Tax=Hygrophoropsis aurantiaca TaxID=72124 RepID=A0ACB8AS97_9AGAM|nr:hypothetical protein BJ138DRAFT_1140509 [Hygrophoropsis aurantiaca]
MLPVMSIATSALRTLAKAKIRPASLIAAHTRPTVLFPTRSFTSTRSKSGPQARQSFSPLHPLGVDAALEATSNPSATLRPKIFDEFSLSDRVAIVTGANRGLGLEMALALCEAGARVTYCLDLPSQPSEEFIATRDFIKRLGNASRLEYISADVRDQKAIWQLGEDIADKEGRMDVCVANAGILRPHTDCLDYSAEQFKEVLDVNTNGVLYTAQAAGRQMARFGTPGSIILIGSMSGSITNKNHSWISYNTSKSAVLQMARSMACELGPKKIRVNSLSPGYIYTSLTATSLDNQPGLLAKWSEQNPLGRLGRPDELRGVITWLASDASTYCTGSDICVNGGHTSW